MNDGVFGVWWLPERAAVEPESKTIQFNLQENNNGTI